MQHIDSLQYLDDVQRGSRYAYVDCDSDIDSDWRISLNGTDANGDFVSPNFVAIDNYVNNEPVELSIDAVSSTVGSFVKVIYSINPLTSEISLHVEDGIVRVYVSEQKLPVGEGTNQFGEAQVAQKVTIANSRVDLASINTSSFTVAFLTEIPRAGLFVFSNADHSADITNDPQQGIYVAIASDPTGKSGAWVRQYNAGEYYAAFWGMTATNSDVANANAGQAAINYVAIAGGILRFPRGVLQHTGLIGKNKIQYEGMGADVSGTFGTCLLYTGTGDGIQVNNPINSSTNGDYSWRNIAFKNANTNAKKGCFADTGSTKIYFDKCTFYGSDRGLILDQSELAHVRNCDFEGPNNPTSLLWIVNGPDRNAGAAGEYTNNIIITENQFNGSANTTLILDDGGDDHQIHNNNLNGGLNFLRLCGVQNLGFTGNEGESAVGDCIVSYSTTFDAGRASGASSGLFDNNMLTPNAGQRCLVFFAGNNVTITNNQFGNSTNYKIAGMGNLFSAVIVGNINMGGPLTVGMATKHFEISPADNGLTTNLPYNINGQQVVGARGASLPVDATDLASVIALANAIKARIKTTGGHGLVAD